VKFEQLDIANLCRTHGPALAGVPDGVDAIKLLWALTGNETRFGKWTVPKHENSYCYKGRYHDAVLDPDWGCLAHCSLGVGQVMAPSVVRYGFGIKECLLELEPGFLAMVAHLRFNVLPQHPASLSDIADAYNSGNFRDSIVPADYIHKLIENYAVPLPV
jgi:hypothetical protein